MEGRCMVPAVVKRAVAGILDGFHLWTSGVIFMNTEAEKYDGNSIDKVYQELKSSRNGGLDRRYKA